MLGQACNIVGEDIDSADMLSVLKDHSYSTSTKPDLGFFR